MTSCPVLACDILAVTIKIRLNSLADASSMGDYKDKEIEQLIKKKKLESEALKKILESINSKREENSKRRATKK